MTEEFIPEETLYCSKNQYSTEKPWNEEKKNEDRENEKITVHNISEGDYVEYRHHEGWITEGLVLDVRPGSHVVVGQHENDPEPDIVCQKKIIKKI